MNLVHFQLFCFIYLFDFFVFFNISTHKSKKKKNTLKKPEQNKQDKI